MTKKQTVLNSLIGLKITAVQRDGTIILKNGMSFNPTWKTSMEIKNLSLQVVNREPKNLCEYLRFELKLPAGFIDARSDHYRIKIHLGKKYTLTKAALMSVKNYSDAVLSAEIKQLEILGKSHVVFSSYLIIRTSIKPSLVTKKK